MISRKIRQWIRLIENLNPDEDMLLYHGTNTPLSAIRDGLMYLTPDEDEAWGYAENGHRFGVTASNPHVHTIAAKSGPILDIEDETFYDELENGDMDAHIAQCAKRARQQGYRFLKFTHPSFVYDHPQQVIISLFPKQDLTIID